MHSLETINAMNAKGAPKQAQGATVKVDTTHRRLNAIESAQDRGALDQLAENDRDHSGDGQYVESVVERPLPPSVTSAMPAWSHKLYFGTGRNARVAVEKGENVLDVARSFIVTGANSFFQGYTLIDSKGFWQGDSEHSFILEVIASRRNQFQDEIVELAKRYRKRFNQDAVIVTHEQVWTEIL